MPRPGVRHEVVHARQEPVGGADVGEHLELQGRANAKAPVPGARPDAGGEPLVRIAVLEVVGVEVRGLVRPDVNGDGDGRHPGVVDPFDAHRARGGGVIDDANEALDPFTSPTRGRREQRDRVHDVVVVGHGVSGRGREIGAVPGGARKQAHDLERLLRAHHEPPLALARAERAGEPRPSGLELERAHRVRRPCRYLEPHRVRGRGAGVVDGLNAHLRGLRSGVDEPQPAHLVDVAPGVEDGHPVHTPAHRSPVVHAREEAVTGADVGEHLEL